MPEKNCETLDQTHTRQFSIAETLTISMGRTMAIAYCQRHGWEDVISCIDVRGEAEGS